jgi:hypothetical protein
MAWVGRFRFRGGFPVIRQMDSRLVHTRGPMPTELNVSSTKFRGRLKMIGEGFSGCFNRNCGRRIEAWSARAAGRAQAVRRQGCLHHKIEARPARPTERTRLGYTRSSVVSRIVRRPCSRVGPTGRVSLRLLWILDCAALSSVAGRALYDMPKTFVFPLGSCPISKRQGGKV